ncbi:unnamed protein product [Prorocentrum cordatum]|uniref:H(+)-exporting diphosphatase n=1 Tax=Prorocentrum cordatum TaxID=2364126 RepID=A0ABN9TIH9_9DINO|nr:unnamed protein product [Polarella glacialis]
MLDPRGAGAWGRGLSPLASGGSADMVEEGGDKIVWVCTAVSVGFAGYKGYVLLAPLVLEDVQDADTSSCNEEDGVIGVLMLLFASILGVFLSRCKDLAVASGYVQAAAECVFQVSGLLLEPLISLVVKLLLPIQLLASFFLFLSTGFRRDDMGDLVIEFDEDCPGVEAIVYYIERASATPSRATSSPMRRSLRGGGSY